MEEYLVVYQGNIVTHLENYKNRMIDKSEFESKLPKSFLLLHQVITKTLREIDLLPK
jgi:hypothetical protein